VGVNVTWAQFKAEVDKALEDAGIAEDIEVKEIDTDTRAVKIKLSNGRLVIE